MQGFYLGFAYGKINIPAIPRPSGDVVASDWCSTDNINWGQHVSEISSKATKTLGFLRRNLAFAPKSTKEVVYKTLVRPKLEYAAPIWSPYSKLKIN